MSKTEKPETPKFGWSDQIRLLLNLLYALEIEYYKWVCACACIFFFFFFFFF